MDRFEHNLRSLKYLNLDRNRLWSNYYKYNLISRVLQARTTGGPASFLCLSHKKRAAMSSTCSSDELRPCNTQLISIFYFSQYLDQESSIINRATGVIPNLFQLIFKVHSDITLYFKTKILDDPSANKPIFS